MIYFFYGTDFSAARAAVADSIDAVLSEKPEAAVFHIDAENFDEAALDEYMPAKGLFEENHIIFLDRICENSSAKEYLLAHLTKLENSGHLVLVLEGALDKKTAARIEKKSARAREFKSATKKARQTSFDTFALTDAVGARDKKRAWVLLQKAFVHGALPEELSGMIFWQIKAMVLSKSASCADEAGLKPFVFNKARRYAENFNEDELRALSGKVIAISHDSKRGLLDARIGLEEFILSL